MPESLLEPDLQTSCIIYTPDKHDENFFKEHQIRFCCCSTEMCNEKIRFSKEKNPYASAFESHKNIITNIEPNLTKNSNSPFEYSHSHSITIVLIALTLAFVVGIFYWFRKPAKKQLQILFNKSQIILRNSNQANGHNNNLNYFDAQMEDIRLNLNQSSGKSLQYRILNSVILFD